MPKLRFCNLSRRIPPTSRLMVKMIMQVMPPGSGMEKLKASDGTNHQAALKWWINPHDSKYFCWTR